MPDFKLWWDSIPGEAKELVSRKDVWDAAVAATRAELAGAVPSLAETLGEGKTDAAPEPRAPAPRRPGRSRR